MSLFRDFTKAVATIIPFNKGIAISKDQQSGIKVDVDNPTFPIMDLKGILRVDIVGQTAPSIESYRDNVRGYAYGSGDIQDWTMHVEHWNLVGGDKYLHAHIRHNGTSISGDLVVTFDVTYNYGHSRVGSPSSIQKVLTIPSATIAADLPQYDTHIADILIAQSGGGAGLLDSDQWQPDDDIMVKMTVTTLPTITGGTTNKIFIPYVDIHCESTGIGTKNSAPDFWA